MPNSEKYLTMVKSTILAAFTGIILFSCSENQKTDTQNVTEQNKVSKQKEIISTEKSPAAFGPYSQAIKAGNTLYISGQIPIDPSSGEVIRTGIEDETHQALKNLKAILHEADYSINDVVNITIYIANMDDFDKLNGVYATYFTENQPARVCIAVKTLPKNVNIEIAAIAWKG